MARVVVSIDWVGFRHDNSNRSNNNNNATAKVTTDAPATAGRKLF